VAASVTIWNSGAGGIADERANPAWKTGTTFACVAFMSASLGLQGFIGKRLNTQFATTSAFSFFLLPFPLACLHMPSPDLAF